MLEETYPSHGRQETEKGKSPQGTLTTLKVIIWQLTLQQSELLGELSWSACHQGNCLSDIHNLKEGEFICPDNLKGFNSWLAGSKSRIS